MSAKPITAKWGWENLANGAIVYTLSASHIDPNKWEFKLNSELEWIETQKKPTYAFLWWTDEDA